MNRWHLNHEYTRNHMSPVLDPGFDELGGELTLAQIRDPVMTWAQIWNPVSLTSGDPLGYAARQRDTIATRRYRLEHWAQRFEQAFELRIPYKRERLRLVYGRLQKARKKEIVYCKTRLQRAAQQLQIFRRRVVDRSLAGYPLFWFPDNVICNNCIPYNWQFTKNYWGTGQNDQFKKVDKNQFVGPKELKQ